MVQKNIHLVGFGSQGAAWAHCLRASGWNVRVYLGRATGPSFERAQSLGFEPRLIENLHQDSPELIAMLCPDQLIGPIYREYLARLESPLTLVLATGYAVYADELKNLAPGHAVAMIAPKAIGPKLQAAHQARFPGTHELVAAFQAPLERRPQLLELARGLGFAEQNLVAASFEAEAIGDLISEQALLCGGVFTLLEWTMENMAAAGVPDALIREECLTELELIAGLIRERGPASTLQKISQAAQCGTIAMRERLEKTGLREALREQAQEVTSKRFPAYFNDGRWKSGVSNLVERLREWERRLSRGNTK